MSLDQYLYIALLIIYHWSAISTSTLIYKTYLLQIITLFLPVHFCRALRNLSERIKLQLMKMEDETVL